MKLVEILLVLIKPGQDVNYNLNTDDISEDQIIDVYYALEENNRKYFEEAISEAISDEDYESEKEKQETIVSWEEDKRNFEEMILSIKSGAFAPKANLKLYPEYSCFMVDCVRHKF